MSKLRVVLAALEGLHADVVDIGLEMSQNKIWVALLSKYYVKWPLTKLL